MAIPVSAIRIATVSPLDFIRRKSGKKEPYTNARKRMSGMKIGSLERKSGSFIFKRSVIIH